MGFGRTGILLCSVGWDDWAGRTADSKSQFQALDGQRGEEELFGSLIQDEQTLGFLRHAGPAAATGRRIFAREHGPCDDAATIGNR